MVLPERAPRNSESPRSDEFSDTSIRKFLVPATGAFPAVASVGGTALTRSRGSGSPGAALTDREHHPDEFSHTSIGTRASGIRDAQSSRASIAAGVSPASDRTS